MHTVTYIHLSSVNTKLLICDLNEVMNIIYTVFLYKI